MKLKNNNSGFSILIAIFMVGFLLILVIWVFNLMLRDMKDNKWSENYIKAYAWAEWAMELWLLKIKEEWYWVDDDLGETNSWILSFHTWKNNEPKISYEMDMEVNNYNWTIWTGSTVIIPLFSNSNYIKKPEFNISTIWFEWDIIWNIIWVWEWMSWTWNFNYSWPKIKYKKKGWWYEELKIDTFLTNNTWSYLMLFNKSVSQKIEYNLKDGDWKFFSKPVWGITSSVQVGKFKQNITTNIDNTEYLRMLKYSLYSK